jgi:hypothetical protein
MVVISKTLVIISFLFILLAAPVQAQDPTPTPIVPEIEYYKYSDTITWTTPISFGVNLAQASSYALTAYDFFKNSSKLVYLIPILIGIKMLYWLYRYVMSNRSQRFDLLALGDEIAEEPDSFTNTRRRKFRRR